MRLVAVAAVAAMTVVLVGVVVARHRAPRVMTGGAAVVDAPTVDALLGVGHRAAVTAVRGQIRGLIDGLHILKGVTQATGEASIRVLNL